MAAEKTRPFQMRVSEEWLATLDDWRRTQPDLPSRAEAIRRLVERGLSLYPPGYDPERLARYQDEMTQWIAGTRKTQPSF